MGGEACGERKEGELAVFSWLQEASFFVSCSVLIILKSGLLEIACPGMTKAGDGTALERMVVLIRQWEVALW